DPERNLPRALVMGTAAIIAIYLLVNAAYLYLLPLGQMARSPLVAADAAQAVLGRIGVGAVTVVVMLATFSTLVGSILTAPRIFFAMADDGLFFKTIAKVHPRYHTPSAAIVLTACLGVGFVLIRTFEQFADQFVVAIFPFYALSSAAVAGHITDESGGPVPDATLSLTNGSTGQSYSARARADGGYSFENVSVGGPYTLAARALGFEPKTSTPFNLQLGQRFELGL